MFIQAEAYILCMPRGPFGGPRPLADRDPVYELRFKVITDELLGGGDVEDLE